MIKSFKDKEAEKLFQKKISRRVSTEIQRAARRKLRLLDRSENLQDLTAPPSNHLEKLSGDRKGQYSIRINRQWRICFEWINNNAYNVEIIDYH